MKKVSLTIIGVAVGLTLLSFGLSGCGPNWVVPESGYETQTYTYPDEPEAVDAGIPDAGTGVGGPTCSCLEPRRTYSAS